MPKYEVNLSPTSGHPIPVLLKDFGAWLSSQEYGPLGWFSIHAESVPIEWDRERVPRIQSRAFSFLQLPDGSLLVLVDIGGKYIRDDLVGVFGSRQGPHGHPEAALDDDWPAVDKATSVFDWRFGEWHPAGGSLPVDRLQ